MAHSDKASPQQSESAVQGQASLTRRKAVPPHIWILIGVMSVFWFALASRIVPQAKQHDFLNLYSGGTLALRGPLQQIYVPEVQFATERKLVPKLPELVPFVRPPFYAFALTALAAIPYRVAFAVWLVLQIAVYIAVLIWAKSRWGPDALLFGAMFLPAALGIASGQDCVFMLAIVAGLIALQDRGRETAAGAVLALGLIKFHLFVVWPLVLLLQKRWRMSAGAALVVGGELLLSLLLVGPDGFRSYIALLRNPNIERLSPSPELMINMHSLALNVGMNRLSVRLALVVFVVALALVSSLRAPFRRAVVAASIASLLVSPHVYGYDAALMFPSLCFLLFESQSLAPKVFAVLLCSPVPYLLNLAGSPWSVATPLSMFCLLVLLARRQLMLHFAAAVRTS